jgi:large subunit ribosomal protein L10
MPLSRDRKKEVVDETGELIDSSKLIVMARYSGTPVKAMQELRAGARSHGTTVRVIKNRLFQRALSQRPAFKDTELKPLTGQLLFAFNADDELAPAQNLDAFAKNNPQLEFIGALTAEGQQLSAEEVKHLASLPSKDQLRAQLVSTIAAPLGNFVNVIGGGVRGLVNVLSAKAEEISN